MDFEGPLPRITKIVGFTPDWEPTKEIDSALYGIAIKRGRVPYDMPVSEEDALLALQSSAEAVALFRHNFPFVALDI